MEREVSLPHSQVPATCPYPKPAWSSSCPHLLRSVLILSFHLRPSHSRFYHPNHI